MKNEAATQDCPKCSKAAFTLTGPDLLRFILYGFVAGFSLARALNL